MDDDDFETWMELTLDEQEEICRREEQRYNNWFASLPFAEQFARHRRSAHVARASQHALPRPIPREPARGPNPALEAADVARDRDLPRHRLIQKRPERA